MTRNGGCQCGAVRYECPAVPDDLYVCHCTECRAQSASAFGISYIVPHASIHLLRGTPRTWSRPTASGGALHCAFCPDCGTRLWHQGGESTSVKGGSLDEPPDLSGAAHIWVRSKLAGVEIPAGCRQAKGEPD